ncbi:MAG TPA: ABC transporter ATP-binding protein [Bacillota bacterium]|nr:ABC transporter ATP-binding protein [Bacillota bacterium]
MGRLWPYLNRTKWYYIFAVIALLISTGLDMFNPRLLRSIIDEVIINGKMELFQSLLGWLAFITLSRALLGYLKEYLFDYGSQALVAQLRLDLFDHLQSLSFSFFDGVNTGELMSRIKDDVDNIWHTFAFGIMLFIEQSVYFVTASILLFYLNWKLALVALVLMPVIGWIAFRLESQIGTIFEKLSDQGVVLNTTAQENLAGIRLVKAFCREKYEIAKFLDQNQENYRLKVEQARVWSKHHPRIEFLTNLSIVLVTTIGGVLVIRSEISVGTLVAFSNYVMMLVWPMRMIGWLTNMLAQCRASLQKIEGLFTEKPAVQEKNSPVLPERIAGEICFENVSFNYHGTPVLKEINLRIPPGSTIAIMGMTGSGKSSLVNLITRYYDCSSGRILIDGLDVLNWPLQTLRQQVAVVMQETFLFSDTIDENIRFGTDDTEAEAVYCAAEQAAIADFIRQLPDNYRTIIGERGIGLSGGQKQRLSLARALLKSAKILILDDATSNLDLETEYRIQKTLESLRGVSKVIIAHRISAVKNADEIILLENGAVVERGTHQELLALGQRYYEIYCEQSQELFDITEVTG